jgi:16S rRNA (cytosine1407-C5)-methyltransferase
MPAASGPRAALPGEHISREIFFARSGLDTSWLPEHSFLCTGGRAYLILDQAARHLPADLRWQGFAVGKTAGDAILADTTLRTFVPPRPGKNDLVLDNVRTVHDLLAGQSLPWDGSGKRCGLYFKGLPLGFLTIKGRRCLWSDR